LGSLLCRIGRLVAGGLGRYAVGVVVLGFVAVIIFVIALGWLAIVSRQK
jgi:hypothetical protein